MLPICPKIWYIIPPENYNLKKFSFRTKTLSQNIQTFGWFALNLPQNVIFLQKKNYFSKFFKIRNIKITFQNQEYKIHLKKLYKKKIKLYLGQSLASKCLNNGLKIWYIIHKKKFKFASKSHISLGKINFENFSKFGI